MLFDALLRPSLPTLDWLQLELTSHCGGRGPYSVYNALRDRWDARHMPWELFQRLTPVFAHSRLIHLQGWGDPLLHPRFVDMARTAGRYTAQLATASMLPDLDTGHLETLIESGVHLLTLHVHKLVKAPEDDAPSELEQLRATLEELARVKALRGSQTPQPVVLVTLTRQNLLEVHRLPKQLAGLGVETMVLNALAFVPDQAQEPSVLVPKNEAEYQEVRARLRRVAAQAEELGLRLHHFLVYGGAKPRGCIERPHRTAFITSAGEVAPCVFSRMPLSGPAHYHFQGMDMEFPRLAFGDLQRQSFERIWCDKAYRRFRTAFARGRLPEHCQSCWRPYLVAE